MKSYFFCRKCESANSKKFLFLLAFPFLFSVFLIGYKENAEKPGFRSVDFGLKGEEEAISCSVVFIVKDESLNLVQILPALVDAILDYPISNVMDELNSSGIVKLNSGKAPLWLCHLKEDFNNSQIQTILFSSNSKHLFNPIISYPSPAEPLIHFKKVKNSGGQLGLAFYNTQDNALEKKIG